MNTAKEFEISAAAVNGAGEVEEIKVQHTGTIASAKRAARALGRKSFHPILAPVLTVRFQGVSILTRGHFADFWAEPACGRAALREAER